MHLCKFNTKHIFTPNKKMNIILYFTQIIINLNEVSILRKLNLCEIPLKN